MLLTSWFWFLIMILLCTDNEFRSNVDISCVGDVDWIKRFNDILVLLLTVHVCFHERPNPNHRYLPYSAASMDGQKLQAVTKKKKKTLMKYLLRIVFWWKSICQQVHLIAVITVLFKCRRKRMDQTTLHVSLHISFSHDFLS